VALVCECRIGACALVPDHSRHIKICLSENSVSKYSFSIGIVVFLAEIVALSQSSRNFV
jgi:hypothetical protein